MFKKIGLNVDNYVSSAAIHIKINQKDLEKNPSYKKSIEIEFGIQGNDYDKWIDTRNHIFEIYTRLNFEEIKFKPVKKTMFFDFMTLGGFFLFSNFIISEGIKHKIDLLPEEIQNNVLIKEIWIEGLKEQYYIMFIPFFDERNIIFEKSVLYEYDHRNQKVMDLDIKNYDDYKNEIKKHIFSTYENLTLPKQYQNLLAISVASLGLPLLNTKFIDLLSEKEKENLVIKDFPMGFE